MSPLGWTTSLYLHLPLLIVLICLVYSATRFDDWGAILHETMRWIMRMVGFLGVIALALFLVAVLI
jgi:integral membrane sensor domain MASE1